MFNKLIKEGQLKYVFTDKRKNYYLQKRGSLADVFKAFVPYIKPIARKILPAIGVATTSTLVPCKDCNAKYCGQTRRPLHLRLSEHQRFTNNSKSFTSTNLQYTSAVAHHAHTTGHTIDFKSTHILSLLTKSSQLDLIKHAAIKIICPSLNKLHSAPNINNQWTDLLPTIKNSFRPRLAYPP